MVQKGFQTPKLPRQFLRFEAFTIDPVRRLLLRGKTELPLRQQSFEVLRYLAERAGTVVSSEELIDTIWSARPADGNASVSQCIKEIRRALGDDARWIVRTIAGRGYEFMAKVVRVHPPPSDLTVVAGAVPQSDAPRAHLTAHIGTIPTPLKVASLAEPRSLLDAAGWPRKAYGVLFLIAVLVIGSWWIWAHLQAVRPAGLTMMAAPTIAVLPFTDAEGGGSRVSANLADEIRSELARVHRGFDLVIRAAGNDSDRPSDFKLAGTRLDARYVVSGTTWLDQDVQRANIRLIESETEKQLWSEPFEFRRDEKRSFNRLAARIARQLVVQVRTAENRRPLPAKAEAGHYALQARALHETERGPNSTREAQALFKKALALDASSIPALHGFAVTTLVLSHNAWIPWERRPSALLEAKDTIDRLIRLDPGSAVGHYLRASLLRAHDEVDQAIASLEHALSLNPNYFSTHFELGRIKIDAGRAHEAIGHIEDAIELSPPEPNIHVLYYVAGMAAVHISDDHAAVQWLLKAHQANPSFHNSALLLAVAYLGIGEDEKAQASLAVYVKQSPNFSIAGWNRYMSIRNPVAMKQRERIVDAFRRLGVPEDNSALASR